ncbi:MAG TPA: LysR family transcriptional regulator [Candidatus Acidoferrum sp.]|nr:LysR family transcriptional regulator [Candidatus Acidoferrum sp.]
MQQLLYFRTAAQYEHVTRAADELEVSQSAVSRAIAQLEDELGVPLFERKKRGVGLNRFGQLFLEHVVRAHGELEEGRRALADAAGSAQGVVALGFLHSLGVDTVPRLLKAYRRHHPSVRFELQQDAGDTLMERLEDGTIDLCLSMPELSERRAVRWAALVQERLVLAVPRDHILAERRSVRLTELSESNAFVACKPGNSLRTIFDQVCATASLKPTIAFEGTDVATLRGLVAAGLGIAILPSAQRRASGIREVPISPGPPVRKIGIAWIVDRYLSRAAADFRDFVIEQMPTVFRSR